jgi:hypothetical protein
MIRVEMRKVIWWPCSGCDWKDIRSAALFRLFKEFKKAYNVSIFV